MLTADEVKNLLDLEPLRIEGGFFRETYRSPYSTAIYYLHTASTKSVLHRLKADEVYHFYLGDPVELLTLPPSGEPQVQQLGHDLASGMVVQSMVPQGVWQGSRLVPGGAWALMGTTMAPGFELQDFEPGFRDELVTAFPAHRELITALT